MKNSIQIHGVSRTYQLHARIICRVQVGKAVFWHHSPLKADALGFPQALFKVGHTAHLTAQTHFSNGNELIAHGAVQQRRHHTQADRQIAGSIPQGNAAHYVDIDIQIAKEIPCPLFQNGNEQIHAVIIIAAAGTAR